MIDDTLSYVKISEYTVGFIFDSGDSVSAFSKVSFLDENGFTISTFLPGNEEPISIPISGYLGAPIARVVSGSGFVTIEFKNGRLILVQRVAQEVEVALLMQSGTAKAIS